MIANGIKATTTTTGTGTLTLSNVSGYAAIGDWFADGSLVEYSLTDGGSPEKLIETGIGTYTASGTTLARTYVTGTYVSGTLTKDGSAITAAGLSGTTTVYISAITGASMPGVQAINSSIGSAGMLLGAFPEGIAATGGPVTANRLYLTEYIHRTMRRVKGFRVYCGTTSGNINFGIYQIKNDGSLGAQLATTGSKVVASGLASYALTTPIWLPPDYYAVGVIVDNATASFRTIAASGGGYAPNIFGSDASGYPVVACYTSPGSFTLPSPFSGSLTSGMGGPITHVELQ